MRALQPKCQMSGFEKFGPTLGAGRGITTESASVSRCGDSRTEKLFECICLASQEFWCWFCCFMIVWPSGNFKQWNLDVFSVSWLHELENSFNSIALEPTTGAECMYGGVVLEKKPTHQTTKRQLTRDMSVFFTAVYDSLGNCPLNQVRLKCKQRQ